MLDLKNNHQDSYVNPKPLLQIFFCVLCSLRKKHKHIHIYTCVRVCVCACEGECVLYVWCVCECVLFVWCVCECVLFVWCVCECVLFVWCVCECVLFRVSCSLLQQQRMDTCVGVCVCVYGCERVLYVWCVCECFVFSSTATEDTAAGAICSVTFVPLHAYDSYQLHTKLHLRYIYMTICILIYILISYISRTFGLQFPSSSFI